MNFDYGKRVGRYRRERGGGGCNKPLKELLSRFLSEIEEKQQQKRGALLSCWDQLMQKEWRGMSQAVSLEKGILLVEVYNAILYTILMQQGDRFFLKELHKKVPDMEIKKILFRIGVPR